MKSYKQFLIEGSVNFQQFLSPYWSDEDTRLAKAVQSEMKQAKTYLKKEPKMLWFARWVKLIACAYKEEFNGSSPSDKLQKEINIQAPKLNISPESCLGAIKRIYTDYQEEYNQDDQGIFPDYLLSCIFHEGNRKTWESFAHLFSLGIPEIDAHDFQGIPNRPINDLFELEIAYKNKITDRTIPAENEDEDGWKRLIKFPDGDIWFSLEKPYCGDEGQAMGHCGNSDYGRQRGSYDNIISLRSPVKHGSEILAWSPHITITVDPNGMIRESKGRGNEAPIEKYYDKILALFKLPVSKTGIKGLKGGGYLPENNFHMEDFSTEQTKDLEAARPDFIDSSNIYYRLSKKMSAEGTVPENELEILIDMLEEAAPSDYSYEGVTDYSIGNSDIGIDLHDKADDLIRMIHNFGNGYPTIPHAIIGKLAEDIEVFGSMNNVDLTDFSIIFDMDKDDIITEFEAENKEEYLLADLREGLSNLIDDYKTAFVSENTTLKGNEINCELDEKDRIWCVLNLGNMYENTDGRLSQEDIDSRCIYYCLQIDDDEEQKKLNDLWSKHADIKNEKYSNVRVSEINGSSHILDLLKYYTKRFGKHMGRPPKNQTRLPGFEKLYSDEA